MKIQYPLYVEEKSEETYMLGSEEYRVKQIYFMVPWKFGLFVERGEGHLGFKLTRRPTELAQMNEYILKNKGTLRKISAEDSSLRFELDKLIEFFSTEQRNETEFLDSLDDLLLFAGIFQ